MTEYISESHLTVSDKTLTRKYRIYRLVIAMAISLCNTDIRDCYNMQMNLSVSDSVSYRVTNHSSKRVTRRFDESRSSCNTTKNLIILITKRFQNAFNHVICKWSPFWLAALYFSSFKRQHRTETLCSTLAWMGKAKLL